MFKVSRSNLENPVVKDKDLEYKKVIPKNYATDFRGFSVYKEKLCLFGSDGIFLAKDWKD